MTQPAVTDEKGMLIAYLDAQRKHVLGILEGLSEEDMHRAVMPSGWTPAGLLNHLALDDERFWFQAVVAGEQPVIASIGNDGDAWKGASDRSAADLVALYRQEIDRSNAIIAATPLDAPPAWWPAFFGTFRLDNLRDVLLHVITETACHAGHADAAREMIDGKRWMVLTE
ncbi:MAG: DinB family protein [Chloroflexi bacterium]|nr:DinB family protein [Chloroflexota bacterium]